MPRASEPSRRRRSGRAEKKPLPTARPVRDLAYVEVASTELAREINRDIVLELIRAHQPIARVDLVRHSGLQNSTVSSIVEQLLDEGWIREGEAVKTARGRRPTQISLNDALAMLVADVRPGRAALAAVDLNGRFLSRGSVALPTEPQRGVEVLGQALRAMRDAHPQQTFEGAGICVPGRIDPATRRLLVAPNLRWQDFAVGESLTDALEMPVELENDANACLLSELWFGHLDGVRNAVLLAISEGLGASILADGQLIAGHQGMAGEFGHVCYDPEGPTCGCGRRGCWEVFASSTAALRAYRQAGGEADGITYEELAQRAGAGDRRAADAIHAQAVAIGRGLRMVAASLSPEVISFAGEITLAWPLIAPVLREESARTLLAGEPPRLLSAGDGETAHLLGAAAVVLQRHSGYYRSRAAFKVAHSKGAGGRSRAGAGSGRQAGHREPAEARA
jgi:predicted NBD/HSP70 family sugar kinase